jgi:hypothetical protein
VNGKGRAEVLGMSLGLKGSLGMRQRTARSVSSLELLIKCETIRRKTQLTSVYHTSLTCQC